MTETANEAGLTLLSTGIEGLDEVLGGGLVANRLYLLEGDPGAGKTTLALRFLLEGAARGETCMYVTLSESEEELRASADSHGWSLDPIHVLEIIPAEETLTSEARNTMFHPSEVELAETTKRVLAEAARLKPTRLVLDSLSEFRLLAENPLRYRRQILALKKYFSRERSTVLFIDDRTGEQRDMHLHSLAHGVIALERRTAEYGSSRRMLQVAKLRGRSFRDGYHDFAIKHGGLQVYPRLVSSEHRAEYPRESILSGVGPLDALLGGGLARGTSTLIMGAAGTGKSSLATLYACTAASRGERVAMFLFEESIATFLERCTSMGLGVRGFMESGEITVRQIDPAEMSAGEFSNVLRHTVEAEDTRIVVIDSLNGYLNAMPNEKYLVLHLHELLMYLGHKGVTTLLLLAQNGFVHADASAPVDASYLADTAILLRYFEAFGEVRQAISVMKKRTGKHERTIRELRFNGGVHVGEPLRNFQGLLTGLPQFVGENGVIAKASDATRARA